MRRIGAITVTVLLLSAAGAVAGLPPVGRDRGVVAGASHGKLVFKFNRRGAFLFQHMAGRLVEVDCYETLPPPPRGTLKEIFGELLRGAKTGMRLPTRFPAGKYDLCTIALDRRGVQRTIPLTPRGAIFEDEAQIASGLLDTLDEATVSASGGNFPPSSRFVDESGGFDVALAAPTDSPPRGKEGVYSDGQQHFAAVRFSANGRRLYIEISGDQVSTNVLQQLDFITTVRGSERPFLLP